MAKQFGDYKSVSDMMNVVANSALSTLEVSIVSAAMISVDILPGETIGVSCTDALPISVYGTGSLPVSVTDLLPPETLGVSCTDALGVSSTTPLSVQTGDIALQVSAIDLDVTADIPGIIGVSAIDLDVTADIPGIIGVSAIDLDVTADIPGTIGVSGMTLPDFTGVSAATTMSAGLQPYTVLNAGMTSAVAHSGTYQLPDVACKSVAVKSDDDNSNIIYIGGATVAGDGANGYRLNAGQSISLRLDNVNRIYFCAEQSAEKIYYIVIN